MKIKTGLLWLSLLFICPLTQASTPSEQLYRLMAAMKSYKANFTQLTQDDAGNTLATSEGQFKLLRPNQLIWETIEPAPMQVIIDGQFLWNYDIELEQITQQPLNAALAQSPATLLLGQDKSFLTHYQISMVANTQCSRGVSHCFYLQPKVKDSEFEAMWLGFADDLLIYLKVTDLLGQVNKIYLQQPQLNPELNSAHFEFVPPPGVDVIQAYE
jgi:outer membrane lipoprotein carrier protein